MKSQGSGNSGGRDETKREDKFKCEKVRTGTESAKIEWNVTQCRKGQNDAWMAEKKE